MQRVQPHRAAVAAAAAAFVVALPLLTAAAAAQAHDLHLAEGVHLLQRRRRCRRDAALEGREGRGRREMDGEGFSGVESGSVAYDGWRCARVMQGTTRAGRNHERSL
jgi:hypothetical protein